jgi:hypothetical protein
MTDKHPGGRPTDYTEETAAKICLRLSDGESLRTICADEGMPDRVTVFRWLGKHEEFRNQYVIARDQQADSLFDEMLDIADDGTNDWMERKNSDGQNIGWQENGEALRRSTLRIDTRKWVAARLAPKKYGERVTNVVEGGDKPVEVKDVSPRQRRAALALALTRQAKG